jgi:protein phosphatase
MNQRTLPCRHHVEHAARTDVGLRRSTNQDAYAALPAPDPRTWRRLGHLFMVADGMGGYTAGELAAQMAVRVGPRVYRKARRSGPPQALLAAMREVNRRIFQRGREEESLRGMGTTTSALVLLPQEALVAHVGDSRVYRLRGNLLEQLTFDHSLVWELCEVTRIPEAEALHYVPRNIITRCMGREPDVEVDLEGPFRLEPGDAFLLCSDGLSGQVENRELGAILRCLPPDEAARTLVDLAILRGGKDNITVLVVRTGAPCPDQGAPGNSAGAGSVSAEPSEPSFGRAPYASADCTPDRAFLDHLDPIVQQLRELAARDNSGVATAFNDQAAEQAADDGPADVVLGVRQRCRRISVLVSQLRARCGFQPAQAGAE